jgi:hypothetical protein
VPQSPLYSRSSFFRTSSNPKHLLERAEPRSTRLRTIKARTCEFLATLRQQFFDALSCDPSRATIPFLGLQDDIGCVPSEWGRLRLEVLSRDRYRCTNCHQTGDEVTLTVCCSRPGTLHPKNMATLCARCDRQDRCEQGLTGTSPFTSRCAKCVNPTQRNR